MANWGYEKGFVVEHVYSEKKKICCRDCIYYEGSDHSCNKRPVYFPEDGYGLWKKCKDFRLDKSVDNLEEKEAQYDKLKKKTKKKNITERPKTVQTKAKSTVKAIPKPQAALLTAEQIVIRSKLLTKKTLVWGQDVNDVGEVIEYSSPYVTIKYDNGKTKKYDIDQVVKDGILRPL